MDAIVILEQMGLKFLLKGEGKVISQSIKSELKSITIKKSFYICYENIKRYYLRY